MSLDMPHLNDLVSQRLKGHELNIERRDNKTFVHFDSLEFVMRVDKIFVDYMFGSTVVFSQERRIGFAGVIRLGTKDGQLEVDAQYPSPPQQRWPKYSTF